MDYNDQDLETIARLTELYPSWRKVDTTKVGYTIQRAEAIVDILRFIKELEKEWN